ncbi:MAG: hypothetical protein ABEI96_11505 [Haloarculaceae archaeon]
MTDASDAEHADLDTDDTMVRLPRHCPHCNASWLECGLPNPDARCERLGPGIWKCYHCETVVDVHDASESAV